MFGVPIAGTDSMDTLGTELGVSGLTAKLQFSLFCGSVDVEHWRQSACSARSERYLDIQNINAACP